MSTKRALPAKRNPLLAPERTPPYEELVSHRRLGQTDLKVKPGQIGTSNAAMKQHLGLFAYAHLRAPLPKDLSGSEIFVSETSQESKPDAPIKPEAYFLMRRSKDGYVSATGMFKASFPWATHAEEEAERNYIKTLEATGKDEIAGNVWIPEAFALSLAEEYGMAPWVKALLDPSPVHSEETKKQIASPPPFIFAAGDKPNLGPPSTPANAGRGRGRPRAGSPVKGTPAAGKASSPRKRATKAQKEAKEAAKEVNAAAARQASESLHAAVDGMSEAATTLVKKGEKALESSPMVNGDKTPAKKSKKKEKEEGGSSSGAKKKAIKAEPKEEKVTVEVQTGGGGAQVNGDVDGGEQTSVKVRMPPASPELPLPQSTEHVIATAKEMVAEARKLEAESAGGGAKAGGAKGRAKGKRKLDEVKDSEDDEAEDKVRDEPSAKRARVAEQEVQRQTVRNRALLGAGLTLAIGAVIPYVLGG